MSASISRRGRAVGGGGGNLKTEMSREIIGYALTTVRWQVCGVARLPASVMQGLKDDHCCAWESERGTKRRTWNSPTASTFHSSLPSLQPLKFSWITVASYRTIATDLDKILCKRFVGDMASLWLYAKWRCGTISFIFFQLFFILLVNEVCNIVVHYLSEKYDHSLLMC